MSEIYTPWNHGLGDRWATVNLLLHKARAENRILTLANAGREGLHREILNVLDAPQLLHLTNEPGNIDLNGFNVWATDFFPTRDPWYWRGEHRTIALHFAGISAAADKNPPESDQQRIFDHLLSLGYKLKFLGVNHTIQQAVEILSSSAFFVGVDSGFSHIAHSVGVPLFLLQYKLPVVTCHRNKKYILCEGAGDLIDWKLPAWLHYRKFLGL